MFYYYYYQYTDTRTHTFCCTCCTHKHSYTFYRLSVDTLPFKSLGLVRKKQETMFNKAAFKMKLNKVVVLVLTYYGNTLQCVIC